MAHDQKDFLAWTRVKIALQASLPPPYFYEREIWWTAIGRNIGSEEDGKSAKCARPVLILRKFNRQLFWGVPLTTTDRTGPYYVQFRYKPKLTSTAILSQLRAFDTKRLLSRDGMISEIDFATIQLGLVKILRAEPRK